VLAFGGRLPFNKPRAVTINGNVFTKADNLESHFNHLNNTDGGDNNDVFEAIIAASKLIFRPGSSKIFVLIPCSNCSAIDTRVWHLICGLIF
jgi:hypothetical protein